MSDLVSLLFPLVVVIYSIILHEIGHGYAAYVQGDHTAYRAGRLTLNPLAHIDMMGSVIVPLVAFLSAGTTFGWAKPVPYNVHNVSRGLGEAFVAAAGVLVNLAIAVVTVVVYKLGVSYGIVSPAFLPAVLTIVSVNVSLAFFNLIPIPPFDGMGIIQAFFPRFHVSQAFIYNPLYLVGAILLAAYIFGMISPFIQDGIMAVVL